MDPQTIAFGASVAAGAFAFLKWAVGEWLGIRRDEVAAIVGQATATTALAAKVDELMRRLDSGFESISKVNDLIGPAPAPITRPKNTRTRTQPMGHPVREARRGATHDERED